MVGEDASAHATRTPLSLLLVGGGLMGERHLVAFEEMSQVEMSVCEQDAGRLEQLAQRHEIADQFDSVTSALERGWDGVVVATPAHTHVPIGVEFTRRGIPVLVEKPLALTAAGVEDWIDLEKETGAPVMVGYPFRCHRLVAELRRLVDAGEIGDPVQIVVSRGADLAARRPDYASTYYASEESGGGIIHDILTHALNLCEWIVGPVSWLECDAAHMVLPGVEVPDTVHVIARHGATMASYSIAQHHSVAHFSVEIHGTKGSLRAEVFKDSLERSSGPDGTWIPVSVSSSANESMLVSQAKTFLEVIAGRAEPPCDLVGGLETLNSVGAANDSARGRAF